jgi:hypothetical protein
MIKYDLKEFSADQCLRLGVNTSSITRTISRFERSAGDSYAPYVPKVIL